jgi:membrane associated rhomboid family serine protease
MTSQSDGGGGVPVCPRHPNRESYVRCQRCERPVCPQCQRPAAVGIQCVDCVREYSRTSPTARTAFGGTAGRGRPVVTLSIIAICVAVYLLQIVPGSSVTRDYSYVPALTLYEPYRMLTAAFLHSPGLPIHIAFNMYALWITGPYLEQLLGRWRFAVLYLVSAIGGSVGMLVLADPYNESWMVYGVGASGAIFGLFGAIFVLNHRLGQQTAQIVGLIVVNFLISRFVPNVAWQAHLGGLVTGVVAAAVLAYAPRPRRGLVQVLGLVAVSILLGVAVAVKVASVTTGSFY